MDDSQFETLASTLIEAMMETLDEQIGDAADVDMQGGILTIQLDSGGQYVINKHGPNHQIWVSSPVSGAWHFGWRGDGWVESREGREMVALLEGELGTATGGTVSLAGLVTGPA